MSSTENIKKIFLTLGPPDQAFYKLQEVLQNIGLKNLKIKESAKYSYIHFIYKEGLIQKGTIQIYFFARKTNTEFWINWSYPSNEENQSEDDNTEDLEFGDGAEILNIAASIFSGIKNRRKSSSINYTKLIGEIGLKMGAKELSHSQGNEAVQFQKSNKSAYELSSGL